MKVFQRDALYCRYIIGKWELLPKLGCDPETLDSMAKGTMGLLTSLASDEEDELVPPAAAVEAEVPVEFDALPLAPTPTKKEVKE